MAYQFWQGFVSFPFQGYFLVTFLIGVFSYGTGLFGSLIFLDKRENTFTVPANRASSILAGVIAELVMVAGYFLYECFILGFGGGAAAEIPANLLQGAFGAAAGSALFGAISKTPYFRNMDEQRR